MIDTAGRLDRLRGVRRGTGPRGRGGHAVAGTDLGATWWQRRRGRGGSWTFAQKQTGADRLTLGGALAANVHGRGLTMPPIISDVESISSSTPRASWSTQPHRECRALRPGDRRLRPVRRHHSVTLRLVPRRKLERVVEVRTMDGLPRPSPSACATAISTATSSTRSTKRRPISCAAACSSCYRPVETGASRCRGQRELREKRLERAAVPRAQPTSRRRSSATRATTCSTNGQLYWSDEHQMSIYPETTTARSTSAWARQQGDRGDHRDLLRARSARALHGARCATTRGASASRSSTARCALIEQDHESFLAWARKPYACVIFNLHIEHTTERR